MNTDYDRDSSEPYKKIEYKGRKYSLRKFALGDVSKHYKDGDC